MAQIESRTLTDVPAAEVAFHKSVLEEEGFFVAVHDQGGGLFTLVGTKQGGNTPPTGDQNTLDRAKLSLQAKRFKAMLDFIAQHEGTANQPGGGYNTSLGFGIFTGGEHNLVEMSLLQIDVLQTQMLANPNNHYNSSAIGRYQILRMTLRRLKAQLKLPETALFDQELQDQLGVTLILGRGRNVAGLRLEWASLQHVDSADILATFDADSSLIVA
jgi:muramidase (phage lysozyme)